MSEKLLTNNWAILSTDPHLDNYGVNRIWYMGASLARKTVLIYNPLYLHSQNKTQ
jgi:hypothetical protein